MVLRRAIGCLIAALAVCAWTACKHTGNTTKPSGDKLEQRCQQLAKSCGDNDKHVEKIAEGCEQAGKAQAAKGCSEKAIALYDCYEKAICGKTDKVWAFDDLQVLASRHQACAAEEEAVRSCTGK